MIDWNTTAFVFPGQASQQVGMGRDIAAQYPIARAIFEQADDLLGFSLSQLCFEGPEAVLNDTINTQPALYVCSIATLKALESAYPDVKPAMVAGHSLGELSALAVVNAMSFEDGLRLVRARGRLMKEAGEINPGAMAAVLGLDADKVAMACQQASADTGGVVIVANDNCPGQLVISGDHAAVDAALALAQVAGARKTVKLAVSIAAHSPLMAPAQQAFERLLADIPFRVPDVPIYSNVTAQRLTSVEAIRQELAQQLTHSVRWTETIQGMVRDGAQAFIEIGSGDVLTGMIKRIDRAVQRFALNNSLVLREFLITSA